VILTSPFLRCAETAHRISEAWVGKGFEVDYQLSEYMNVNWFASNPLDDLMIYEWDFPIIKEFV
jgi:hypothetical protein